MYLNNTFSKERFNIPCQYIALQRKESLEETNALKVFGLRGGALFEAIDFAL